MGFGDYYRGPQGAIIRLMMSILHYLKDPKLWEFCSVPFITGFIQGYVFINRRDPSLNPKP